MDRDRQVFLPDGLVLRESPIEGLGVFATKDFPANYYFGPFTGVEMTSKEFHSTYGKDYTYTYRLRRINRLIVAKENRNFITFINDGVYGQATPSVNVQCKNRGCYSVLPISAGEELLLSYGAVYWKSP